MRIWIGGLVLLIVGSVWILVKGRGWGRVLAILCMLGLGASFQLDGGWVQTVLMALSLTGLVGSISWVYETTNSGIPSRAADQPPGTVTTHPRSGKLAQTPATYPVTVRPDTDSIKKAIEKFLFSFWLVDMEKNHRRVECIFSKVDWNSVNDLNALLGWVLPKLTDGHDGPHLPKCPADKATLLPGGLPIFANGGKDSQ